MSSNEALLNSNINSLESTGVYEPGISRNPVRRILMGVAALAASVGVGIVQEGVAHAELTRIPAGQTVCTDLGVEHAGQVAALNATVTEGVANGFMTVTKPGDSWTDHSTVNFAANQDIANGTDVEVGANGQVCVTASAAAHMLIDVSEFYQKGAVQLIKPYRAMDTRTSGIKPVAGKPDCVNLGAEHAGQVAILNVTATRGAASGFMTATKPGDSWTDHSTVNFAANQDIANGAKVEVGSDGNVCLTASAPVDKLIDVNGFFQKGIINLITPKRFLDTRNGIKPNAGQTVCTDLGVEHAGQVAALNATVTEGVANGFMTVTKPGDSWTDHSTVNFAANQDIANGTDVEVGANGQVCVTASAAAHMLIDVSGYYAAGSVQLIKPYRAMDTRTGPVTSASGYTVLSMPEHYPTFNPANQLHLSCQILSYTDIFGNPMVGHQLTTIVDGLKPQDSDTAYMTGTSMSTKLVEDNYDQYSIRSAYADTHGVAKTYDSRSYPVGTSPGIYGHIAGMLTVSLQEPWGYSNYGTLTARVDITC